MWLCLIYILFTFRIIDRTVLILQLDDWVLCRIYNKKGAIEKQNQGANRKPASAFPEPEDKKPEILTSSQGLTAHPPLSAAAAPATGVNDFLYFDTSESVPRLHTDSSCSEHVVSPEFTCEVQSEPKWKEWEKALDFPYNYMDATVDSAFAPTSGGAGSYQMSPLQDIFMYLPKPF